METLLAAAITAFPSTLVAMAGWRHAKAGRQHSEATRTIVTGNGHGTVTALGEASNALLQELLERQTNQDGKLDSVLRWQGDHAADHARTRRTR